MVNQKAKKKNSNKTIASLAKKKVDLSEAPRNGHTAPANINRNGNVGKDKRVE